MTNDKLRALVDSLQESITDWGDNMRNEAMVDLLDHTRRIRAALPALCAEVDALRKDAERYRWLRDDARQVNAIAPLVFMADDFGVPSIVLDHADLDAAIDAARSRNEYEG